MGQPVSASQINFTPGGPLVAPSGGVGFGIDQDGSPKLIDQNGNKSPLTAIEVAATALARAQALCGPTLTTLMGSTFDNDQWFRIIAVGSGTGSLSTVDKGGVILLSTGASSGSFGVLYPHGSTTIHVDNPQTSRWYMRFRVKWTSVADAQTTDYVGIAAASGGNPLTRFGLRGVTSTGFFSASSTDNAGTDQASTTTTVAYDTTAYHTIEHWNDGTNLNFAIDGVTVFTTPKANVGTNAVTPTVVVGNGTTAAARTMSVDSMYTVVAEN